jgi:protein-tyrosine phosphatase
MNDLFNFRDLAGMTTVTNKKIRSRKVFRTGNISHIELATAKKLKQELNIGTYVDFRNESEIKAFGKPQALIDAGVNWINLHIETDDEKFGKTRNPGVEDWVGLYSRLFEKNIQDWVKFLKIILSSPDATLYGCVFGKDRTGIATSFLLATLDVHEEHIKKDYALTTESMVPHFYNRFLYFWDRDNVSEADIYKHYLIAHPEIIVEFMGFHREKEEDLFQILNSAGFTSVERENLRKKLLI